MYEIPTRTLFGFFASGQGARNQIIGWFEEDPVTIYLPGVLPLLLCEQNLDIEMRQLDSEQSILFQDARHHGFEVSQPGQQADEKELIQATRNTTLVLETVAWFSYAMDRLEATIGAIDGFNEHVQLQSTLGQRAEGLNESLSQRMTDIRARIMGCRGNAKMLKEQAEAMVQTVWNPPLSSLRYVF